MSNQQGLTLVFVEELGEGEEGLLVLAVTYRQPMMLTQMMNSPPRHADMMLTNMSLVSPGSVASEGSC